MTARKQNAQSTRSARNTRSKKPSPASSLPESEKPTPRALTKAQQMMMEDGAPDICFMSREERAKVWEAAPPKPLLIRDEKREEELERFRAAQAAFLEAKQAGKAAKRQSRQPHPDAVWDPKKVKWVVPVSAKYSGPGGPVLAEFKTKHGTNRERCITRLVRDLGKTVSYSDLLETVYGNPHAELGPLRMVIKGMLMSIDRDKLPYRLTEDKKAKTFKLERL